jgi:hypothetical protein
MVRAWTEASVNEIRAFIPQIKTLQAYTNKRRLQFPKKVFT